MKRTLIALALFAALFGAKPASAASTQILVQSNLSQSQLSFVCLLEGCQVSYALNGSPNNFFVLSASSSFNAEFLVDVLNNLTGIVQATIVDATQNPVGTHYIVRVSGGLAQLQSLCLLNLCQIIQPLDGALNQVFLVAGPSGQDPNVVLALLTALPGVVDAEVDQVITIASGGATATTPPPSLVDTTPVPYYGSTVWNGYVNQPATQIIQLSNAQNAFAISGYGIIADIDTGVDPNHPVLLPVLLPGYDFIRNQAGGSEMNDLPSGTPVTETPCVNCTPGQVNQHSIAMVDQHSIAMVDSPGYADFGHGTMVAGLLHLVAPTASLMPLKAFGPDGTGNLSNIIRAVYYASQNGATVVNMSFDLTTRSQELATAINSAESNGIVFVASAGNDGQIEMVYPAGYSNVLGVASTNDSDQRSSFSNYGDQIVWVAAPGEAIVTTYPFGGYAAGWGTSFSAPLVSGGVSLLQSTQPNLSQPQAQLYMAVAQPLLAIGMGNGRIDLYRASSAANPNPVQGQF
jgi:subtilisin family serine protease